MAKLEEIFKQKVNKTIEKETVHKFSLDEERFYLWLVSAKAQAWWQRTPRVSKFSISLKRIPTRDNPRWTGDFDDDIEELLLARLIFGEAENQPREAKIGTGFTVINRVKKQRSNWGLSNREVILKEGEYNAFWHRDRREKVRDPLEEADAITREAWQESYEIAVGILNSSIKDNTKGATNFHSFERKEEFPNWATDKNYKTKMGTIYFYELDR